ncbi:MAG: restriction endonuclease subunit S [Verrucomicrobiota bacterium]|nr:restriction endonuclease subunit S [Verrucomicrobiota bacterium]
MSNDWPLVAMGDIFAISRGGSPRPIDDFLTDDPDGVNWVMISDATESGKYINSTKKRIRQEGVKRSREVKPGDFLLTNSMSFGRPYIMNTSGCVHDGWLVLSPRSRNASPDFFYHLLGSNFVYAEFVRRAAGATVKNLNIDLVKDVQVPLPPLAEQRRIAEVLDRAEALRAKRRAALAQLDSLTQSLFLDLFGDHKSILTKWPTKKLGELLDFLTSGSRGWAEYYSESGDLFLRIQNVRRDELLLDDIAHVKAPDTAEAKRTRVQPGDVLFSITADLGRTAVVPDGLGPAFINQHLSILRTKALVPRFLSAYFASPVGARQVSGRNKHAVKAGLNFDASAHSSFPFPPSRCSANSPGG